jgi:hypothetical protein
MAAKKKAKAPTSYKAQLFMITGVVMAAVFLPSTIMLAIGMMPTLAAALVDRSPRKTKAVTVGAMNLAGCTPFLLELWYRGHSFEESARIISDPTAVVVMYAAACVGYLIDWALGGIVASLLYQRGNSRKKAILQRQKDLVERWGREVTGELPLDPQGFPLMAAPKTKQ